jgi:hypothetical protein
MLQPGMHLLSFFRCKNSNLFSILQQFCSADSICEEPVTCLTETQLRAAYSSSQRTTKTEHGRMDTKFSQSDSPVGALKNEAARQRWELFHRAIAHAKKSNNDAMEAAQNSPTDHKASSRLLSIAR